MEVPLQGTPMITVHHLNNSRSQRVLWLLEELGVPYDIRRYERDPDTLLAPAALRAVHPLGKSPVITDTSGNTIAESGAIVEFLVDRYGEGRLAPARDSEAGLRYLYWLHYAEGSAMPPLLLKLVFDRIRAQPAPLIAKPIVKGLVDKVTAGFLGEQLRLHLDYVEIELEKYAWFAGDDFTAADIQMSFPLQLAARIADARERPRIAAFLERIQARPGYRRAIDRGGPSDWLG